jgi:hypothetical protein
LSQGGVQVVGDSVGDDLASVGAQFRGEAEVVGDDQNALHVGRTASRGHRVARERRGEIASVAGREPVEA